MTNNRRISLLAKCHRAQGAELKDWNERGTAFRYNPHIANDHEAFHTRAGLVDALWLNKTHCSETHRQALLEDATKRNMACLDTAYAEHGQPLQMRGSLQTTAIAHLQPFDASEKLKRVAQG